MKAINHPRCIALIEVRKDDKAVHLVEELGSGGELFDRIIELGHFTEKDAVHLIHQVFDGIQYLHTHGMIHRDLKPENLLMVSRTPNTEDYMTLKIADFGLSAQRSETKSDAECVYIKSGIWHNRLSLHQISKNLKKSLRNFLL
jgi:serine/threonine protein kinase